MALRFATCFAKCLLLCLLVFPYRASANVDTMKEKTLAMIKPDGVEGNYVEVIKKIILDSGFIITNEMQLQLNEEMAKSFYAEHASKSFFSSLVRYMSSGPVQIMVLEKENAIADWRALIGPTDANKAKVTHPKRSYLHTHHIPLFCYHQSYLPWLWLLFLVQCSVLISLLFFSTPVSEPCVGSTQNEIAFTVQIHHNLLPERYRFSLRRHLQMLFRSMMNYKVVSDQKYITL